MFRQYIRHDHSGFLELGKKIVESRGLNKFLVEVAPLHKHTRFADDDPSFASPRGTTGRNYVHLDPDQVCAREPIFNPPMEWFDRQTVSDAITPLVSLIFFDFSFFKPWWAESFSCLYKEIFSLSEVFSYDTLTFVFLIKIFNHRCSSACSLSLKNLDLVSCI